jgi:hypothetical protein
MFEELSVGLEVLTERTSQGSKRTYTNMAIFGEKKIFNVKQNFVLIFAMKTLVWIRIRFESGLGIIIHPNPFEFGLGIIMDPDLDLEKFPVH